MQPMTALGRIIIERAATVELTWDADLHVGKRGCQHVSDFDVQISFTFKLLASLLASLWD